MQTKYQWVTYGQGYFVPPDSGVNVKKYGLVTRGGRKFYRNYKRALKSGKGISFCELIEEKINLSGQNLRRILEESVYASV